MIIVGGHQVYQYVKEKREAAASMEEKELDERVFQIWRDYDAKYYDDVDLEDVWAVMHYMLGVSLIHEVYLLCTTI